MKKPVSVIGKLDTDTGAAKLWPGVRLVGEGSHYFDCPVCGVRLDKRDLGEVFAHEESCPGLAEPG